MAAKIEELKNEYKTLEYKFRVLSQEDRENLDDFIRKVAHKEKNPLLERQLISTIEKQEPLEKSRLFLKEKNLSLLESLNKE